MDVFPAGSRGETHASNGRTGMYAPGLREAGQRSAMDLRRPGWCDGPPLRYRLYVPPSLHQHHFVPLEHRRQLRMVFEFTCINDA
jgi:hypothetical protein